MLPMADATSLSRLCDGVLVVVREGFTRRKVLNKALESIEKSKLLGVVFNQASMLNSRLRPLLRRHTDIYDKSRRKQRRSNKETGTR